MKRFMVTIHAGGIHVDEQRAGAAEQQEGLVQYPDPNFKPVGDYTQAGEVQPLLLAAQIEVAASAPAPKKVTAIQPEPPRAA